MPSMTSTPKRSVNRRCRAAGSGSPAEVASRTIEEIEASGGSWTFAKLTIANAALRELAEAAGKKRR